jgi:hypothetical protein
MYSAAKHVRHVLRGRDTLEVPVRLCSIYISDMLLYFSLCLVCVANSTDQLTLQLSIKGTDRRKMYYLGV